MNRRFRRQLPVLALAVCTCATGCRSWAVKDDGHIRGKRIQVDDSSLNWVEFIYVPGENRCAAIRDTVRLSLLGSGSITMKIGSSEQVVNDFAMSHDAATWNDILEDSINVDPAMMAEILQIFVDEGLMPVFPRLLPPVEKKPQIRYVGKINNTKFSCATDNRYLVELVERFIETNFSNLLARRRR